MTEQDWTVVMMTTEIIKFWPFPHQIYQFHFYLLQSLIGVSTPKYLLGILTHSRNISELKNSNLSIQFHFLK